MPALLEPVDGLLAPPTVIERAEAISFTRQASVPSTASSTLRLPSGTPQSRRRRASISFQIDLEAHQVVEESSQIHGT